MRHEEYRAWLSELTLAEPPFGVPDVVASGFIRIVTHPRIWPIPTPIDIALRVIEVLRARENHVAVAPGARHWEIFADLCGHANAKGNLIPDAFLAALAIETGSELMTADRDFARFPGLRWRHPLDG